jgi:hypothetical protein
MNNLLSAQGLVPHGYWVNLVIQPFSNAQDFQNVRVCNEKYQIRSHVELLLTLKIH